MTMGTGYPIAAEAFDFEVFQLACTFAASRELSRLSRKRPGVARLCGLFELSEAARRLVSAAAMVRSALDTWSTSRRRMLDDNVGELIADMTRRTTKKPLRFREACNKILHAEVIDLMELSEGHQLKLSYKVTLQGQKGKSQWQAKLDVLAFVEVASRLA